MQVCKTTPIMQDYAHVWEHSCSNTKLEEVVRTTILSGDAVLVDVPKNTSRNTVAIFVTVGNIRL